MKKLALVLAASLPLLALCPNARAEEVEAPKTEAPKLEPPKAEAPKTEERWYGYQTLTCDGAALAFVVLSAASDSHGAQTGFGVASLLAYGVAPSVVHGFHERIGIAFADLGIRVGAPVVLGTIGAIIGIAAQGSNGDLLNGGAVGAAIGLVGGVIAAVVVDAAVFARETVPVTPESKPPPKPSAMTVLPSASPTKNGFSAGLVGTF